MRRDGIEMLTSDKRGVNAHGTLYVHSYASLATAESIIVLPLIMGQHCENWTK
jgi:hypothetical protein